MHRSVLLAAVLCCTGCAQLRELTAEIFPRADDGYAARVLIHRDGWGIPRIEAESDAAALFGAAYAEAEDRFSVVDAAVLAALGRSAEADGPAALAHDVVRRAFRVEALARAEYAAEPDHRRELWDAWATGLNYYLHTHPDVASRAAPFEGWMVFALARPVDEAMVVDGVPLAGVLDLALAQEEEGSPAAGVPPTRAGRGGGAASGASARAMGGPTSATASASPIAGVSALPGASAWAVAPARSADGRTLLLARGAVEPLAVGQRWEVELASTEGLRFTGVAAPGEPLPLAGHNGAVAWAHTAGTMDAADAWLVSFDHPEDPLLYRWEEGWRRAEEWIDTVRVATPEGMATRILRFARTHHGPVVRRDGDGGAVAVRMAGHDEGGALQQRLAMMRATDLPSFWRAHAAMATAGAGTVYADSAGQILHVPAGALPRRPAGYDWSRPVDGSTAATDWEGYLDIDEVPFVYQPASGWLRAAAAGAPLPVDTAGPWTVEALVAAASAARVAVDGGMVAALVDEWERMGAVDHARVEPLDMAVDSIRGWDGTVTVESVAATHYILLAEALRGPPEPGTDHPRLVALERVLARLRADWDTVAVPWGRLNRHQLPALPPEPPFAGSRPSWPVAGAPGWTGSPFVYEGERPGGERQRYGVAGQAWLGVLALGAGGVEAWTVVPYGQSTDPASTHAADQAPLYAGGRLKLLGPAGEGEGGAAEPPYHPGERSTGTPDAGETGASGPS